MNDRTKDCVRGNFTEIVNRLDAQVKTFRREETVDAMQWISLVLQAFIHAIQSIREIFTAPIPKSVIAKIMHQLYKDLLLAMTKAFPDEDWPKYAHTDLQEGIWLLSLKNERREHPEAVIPTEI